jgi:hypothetical protein
VKREPEFKTEAAMCAAFIAWVGHRWPQVKCYAEWAGWDILVVYPEGYQLGIQAKLRLNAEVIGQAAPDHFQWDPRRVGPDYRGILVPTINPLAGIASRLGLIVFWHRYGPDFAPGLTDREDWIDGKWVDWNPGRRHELPPAETDAIAGSPCPVTLTPWKIGALDVLAELAVRGTIQTKRMRELGINPSRWLSYFWLMPGEKRGDWVRGDRCPKFDEQHPTAYALALEKAKKASLSLPQGAQAEGVA